ncbi:MAG: PhoH family protein [Lachnospiraceae bacterium]|nr:PhoH family protein [Lachnospiraceae bacterium]
MSRTEETYTLAVGQMQDIFGEGDHYLKKIEKQFHVDVFDRSGTLHVAGEARDVARAGAVIRQLAGLSAHAGSIDIQNVEYAIALSGEKQPMDAEKDNLLTDLDTDVICHTTNGKPVKPKTLGQKEYVDAIRKNTVVFGIGPAGTGKTYLAMALAISAFQREEVSRIILTRPAIEAGEKLGFLPGDLQSKVDPYLRPLYDALYQIMGADAYLRNAEKGLIEVAPLAYMRGRTLDNAYIILDEAQNTSPAQMKMFLTRIGFGAKVVITGDQTQKDLPPGTVSGLDVAQEVLKGIEDIAVCRFTSRDVVRHPLVLRIVKAYEEYEKKQSRKMTKGRRKKDAHGGKER